MNALATDWHYYISISVFELLFVNLFKEIWNQILVASIGREFWKT